MLNEKYILIILLSTGLSVPGLYCNAQSESQPYLIDVKYWKVKKDTLYGNALYFNQYNFQFNLTLTDTAGKPLAYLSPKEIDGFIYTTGDETIEFHSLRNPADMGRVFLRAVYKGRHTLYQLLDINYSSTIISFLVSYYLWDGKWIQPPITSKYETESLLYHFSKCPELEYKIKTGEYRLPQIKTIISEFEACELTDQYEFFYE